MNGFSKRGGWRKILVRGWISTWRGIGQRSWEGNEMLGGGMRGVQLGEIGGGWRGRRLKFGGGGDGEDEFVV